MKLNKRQSKKTKAAGTSIMTENIQLKWKNRISGEVIDILDTCNLITTVGEEYMARISAGDSSALFRYPAIGTGTTPATVSDTALESEVARALAVNSYEATAKHKLVYEFTFDSNESYAITEVGVFDAPSGGHMLNRSVFTARDVDIDTSLEVTVRITFSS